MPDDTPNPTPACELCGRSGLPLTKHHLIPKMRHRQKRVKHKYTHEQRHGSIAMICRPCHSTVHATLTEKELERDDPTVESLKAHPAIAKFAAWIADKPVDTRVPIAPRKDKTASRNKRKR